MLVGEARAAVVLHNGIEFIEDKTNQLTFVDIQELPSSAYQVNGAKAPNFTFTHSGFWFRFRIPDHLAREDTLVLSISYPLIDMATLYIPQPDGSYRMNTNGRKFPIPGRDLKVRELTYLIHPGLSLQDRYFYIHARTTSSAQFPMTLMSLKEYFNKDHVESIGSRFYIGAMVIMFFYNFIFFLTTREPVYAVYVVFIASACLLVMAILGLGFELVWPNAVAFNQISIPFLIGINIIVTVIFVRMSLPKLREYPRCDLFLKALLLVGAFVTLSSFLFRYEIAMKLGIFYVVTSASYLIWVLAFLSWKGYRPAKFFSMSFTALMSGTILYAAKTMDLLGQHVLIEHAPLIGSATQVALLTLALADQFREIKKEKEAIQTQMIALQEQNIQTLDQKVEARTRDIRSILETITQGIFTFSGIPIRIDPELSRQMQDLFPGRPLIGEDPIDVLFGTSDLTTDQVAQIRSVLDFSMGDDALSFELNHGLLPRFVRIKRGDATLFHEIDWNPIVNREGKVEKFLVAVRDVTTLKSLEERNKQNREELEMIQQIIAVPHNKFSRFLQNIRTLLNQLKGLLHEAQGNDVNTLQRINAFLHTLKGNARTFGFTSIARGAHELEDQIKASTADWSRSAELKKRLEALEAYVDSMEHLSEEKLGRNTRQRTVQCSLTDLDRITSMLQELNQLPLSEAARQIVQAARKELVDLGYESLSALLEDIIQASRKIASQAGKLPPKILLEDEGALHLTDSSHQAMMGIFTHFLTNSVDHGLERPEERTAKGKDPQGTIRIQIRHVPGDRIAILVADDGRGLNLKSIHEKAVARGLLEPDEKDPSKIAMTIFTSGLSTARTVTMLSGRGVGLNVVQRMVQELGGDVRIVFLEEARAESTQVPFAFSVSLPGDRFMQVA